MMNTDKRRRTEDETILLLQIAVFICVSLLFSSTASAQAGGPTTDPFPQLDVNDAQKSIVVNLNFSDRFNVGVASTEVVAERTHGRAGDPPLLEIEINGVDGTRLETFNAWHPLWAFVEDDAGRESRVILPAGAAGRISTEFRADVAEMIVTDVAAELQVISINLLKTTHPYCRENSDDLDCLSIANTPPVCVASAPATTECTADATTVTLDGRGTYDPDDDLIEAYRWSGSFIGATATGETTAVEFAGTGDFLVDLEVEDDFAAISSCSAVGAVVDTTAPIVSCNNASTITPPDTPVTYLASSADSCAGEIEVVVSGYQCYRINGSGRRIDTTRSCRVFLEEDQIQIRNSGGVGNNIEWTVEATDAAGNASVEVCALEVVRPGN